MFLYSRRGKVDQQSQYHKDCGNGKGDSEFALLFGIDIERNGQRCARGGQSAVNLSGKTAIVTGGTMGIGEGCAKALLAAGANVVICARRVDCGKEKADELNALYEDAVCEFVQCDVKKEEDIMEYLLNYMEDFEIEYLKEQYNEEVIELLIMERDTVIQKIEELLRQGENEIYYKMANDIDYFV